MKFVFTVIVGIHAVIHVMGFTMGFGYTEISEISAAISKPQGILWLATSVLLIAGLIHMFYNNSIWKWLLLIAVCTSQVLIIINWPDAKAGSLPNLMIAIVLVFSFSEYFFKQKSEGLAQKVLDSSGVASKQDNVKSLINKQLPVLQKWLHAVLIDYGRINSVRLQQKGQMRTKPEGRWMPFTAEQYVNIPEASFIWTTEVQVYPNIELTGRDLLKDGEGEMSVKLLGLIPIVSEKANPQLNSGALLRYLAEICWYPTAALDERIQWKSVGENAAKATMTLDNVIVSGTFYFTPEGDFEAFESQRFYGGGDTSKLETWHIEALNYRTFNGVRIPNKSEVTWKFLEGDFNWLELEIVDIGYNTMELY